MSWLYWTVLYCTVLYSTVLYNTVLYCTVLTYVLFPAVVPARGHEDVVAAHHLLAHAAAQVEGRAAERLPAS